MDPWQPCQANNAENDYISQSNLANGVGLALHNEQQNTQDQNQSSSDLPTEQQSQPDNLSFGDNFQPFVKLPDSEQYLQSLERKLKTIQKGGRKGANADSILRSLGHTKESCMIKLLSNSVEKLTVEGEVFEELKVNPLLKKLAPEKQALTAEELVHLLKADQLELLLGSINLEEEFSSDATTTADTEKEETPSQGESKKETEQETTAKAVASEPGSSEN